MGIRNNKDAMTLTKKQQAPLGGFWTVASCFMLSACTGQGTGEVSGRVTYLDCRGGADGMSLNTSNYNMQPSFFAADYLEDPSQCAIFGCSDPDGSVSDAGSGRLSTPHLRRRVSIRIQRGSYQQTESDGIMLSIADVNRIKRELLGRPIPVGNQQLTDGTEPMVRMTLYLNATCVAGFPRQFWNVPAIMEATSGTITFDSVYTPDLGGTDEFTAHFDGVHFQRAEFSDARNADLSGRFQFAYRRGRPAQQF